MRSVSIVLCGFGLIFCFFLVVYTISSNLVITIVMSIALTVFAIAILFKCGFGENKGEFTLDRPEDQDESSKWRLRLNEQG